MAASKPVHLRAILAEDWRLWRELRLAALADAPTAFSSRLDDWRDADETRWRQRLADAHNLVGELGHTAVGMVSGMPGQSAGSVYLISLWVVPAARGIGVGDALIAGVVGWARTRHAECVELSVTEHNTAALRAYQRHGFVVTGMDRGTRERHMRLPLSAAM